MGMSPEFEQVVTFLQRNPQAAIHIRWTDDTLQIRVYEECCSTKGAMDSIEFTYSRVVPEDLFLLRMSQATLQHEHKRLKQTGREDDERSQESG